MKYKVILFDVNKESHDIITKETINDENELYSLCIKMDGILNGMINIKKS